MRHHSRMIAVGVLTAVSLAGGVALRVRHARSARLESGELAALAEQVGRPGAKPEDWHRYAEKLQRAGRYKAAAEAYAQFLVTDPEEREARLACAMCWAQAGEGERLFEFVKPMVGMNPRLAVEVLGRPEVQGYMAEERFRRLRVAAGAQSVD